MNYSADDILIDRERRVEFQRWIMKKYEAPLLFMRVNYPGLNKDNLLTNSIIQDVDKIMSDIFSPYMKMKLFRVTAEGPNITMIIDKSPLEIKQTTVLIENNHILGRCIDIDVHDNITGTAISRKDLGLDQRKCFICNNIAHHCIRAQSHKESEIVKFIQDTYSDFMENFYGKKVSYRS